MLSCADRPKACMWNDEEGGSLRKISRMDAVERKIIQMQTASMELHEQYERQFAELRNRYEEIAGVHNAMIEGRRQPLLPMQNSSDELEKLQKRVLDLQQRVDILESSRGKDNPDQRSMNLELWNLEQRFRAFETRLSDLPEDEVFHKFGSRKSNATLSARKSSAHHVDVDPHEKEGSEGAGDEPIEGEPHEGDALIGADFAHVQVTLIDKDIDVESRSREYRDILAAAEIEYPLESDVWGASTFVIIKDFPDVLSGDINQENVMRITIVALVLVLNVLFQILMVYYLAIYIMLPNVTSVQNTYALYHKVAFVDGKFDQERFRSFEHGRKEQICEIGISTRGFLWTCIFLWVARCMNEMRVCYVQKQKLDMIPTLPNGIATIHMVHEVMVQFGDYLKESKNMVVCINRRTYCSLLFVVFVPRLLVSVCLLVMGTAFLTSAQSFEDLLLNTLAMAFIFQIDQLFYEVFLPHRIKQNLQHTKIMTPREEEYTNLSTRELDNMDIKRAYRRSGINLAMVLMATFIWFFVQPVIPGFEFDVHTHCTDFLSTLRKVPCSWMQKDCFPK